MKVDTLKSLISALRTETANDAITPESLGGLLQKIVDAIDTGTGDGINITCEIKDKSLYVKGAAALVQAGYTPYIFRYTVKSNHLTNVLNKTRYHGPKRRGWNVMFNSSFVKVDRNDVISFKVRGANNLLGTIFTNSPNALVQVREIKGIDGKLTFVKVGFGKYTYNALRGKRFKYGIGFLKPGASLPISHKNLATNIAPFKVCVYSNFEKTQSFVTFSL